MDALLDDDEEVRYEAAREIARAGRQALDQALLWVEDDRARMREMACYILGQAGDLQPSSLWISRYPDAVPVLVQRLREDPDERVRSAAAAALGFHADQSSIPALIEAASDSSAEIRFDAAHSLGCFHWSSIDEAESGNKAAVGAALLKLMDDEDDDVRDWATFGIHQGDHDTPETRARLWQALDDPCPDVRGEAADGLAKFGDQSFVPKLADMLLHDEWTCELFFAAAEQLGDPSLLPAVRQAAERWRESLDEGENLPAALSVAIEFLSQRAEEQDSSRPSRAPDSQQEN